MIEHLVLFKFSDRSTEEKKQEAVQTFRDLAKKVPGIVDLATGRNFSERNKGYDVGLAVRFSDRESLRAYARHPEHLSAVNFLRSEAGLEDLLVLDFES